VCDESVSFGCYSGLNIRIDASVTHGFH